MIAIINFGSQTAHLIKRRIEECGVKSAFIHPENALREINIQCPRGIILSGGPASVYEKNAPTIDLRIFDRSIPILGICYGLQLIAHLLGGKVEKGRTKEFGHAIFSLCAQSVLFGGIIPALFTVWMSHGDMVVKLPHGFSRIGQTPAVPFAAIEQTAKKIYGVQFHPEVVHTQFGADILKQFLTICSQPIKKQRINQSFVDRLIADIKDAIGKAKAICALSGGVDSTAAAVLSHRAIGDRLRAVYIDSGLMRQGETKELRLLFKKQHQMRIRIVDARRIFLQKLKGITDPEKKRRAIGATFISVLEREAQKLGARFLIQGTIYPDVIESAGQKQSHLIKTHHNVAGLPARMKLVLVEPLRNLYKDQVRTIGKLLPLPDAIVHRQPFPGPGLAIRIVGEVTQKKLRIVRVADAIIQEEVAKAKLEQTIWQAFAIYTGIQTTGVRGDRRAYGDTIAIRAIEAADAMSAQWSHLPYKVLDTISTRIVNEIPAVNRVVYDITNKPPGTMEWE